MGDTSTNYTNGGSRSYDDRVAQQMLAQASAEELRKVGNLAYLDLQQRYMKLQGQFEGQK